MSSNKPTHKKSFNQLVLEKTTEDLELNRRDGIVFYKLLGFLLRNDNLFPYSSEALSKNTQYSRASIFEALNSLEKKQLIERSGFGFQRKFKIGAVLKEICTTVQNLDGLELPNRPETGEYRPETGEYRPETGNKKTSLELRKLFNGGLKNVNPQNPKPKTQGWPEPNEEEKELISSYKHGLRYPEFQLQGLSYQKAEVLYKRYNSQ